ncbi:MAG: hypothetical protein KDA29_00985 [Phycisphaerales bacterium]|nr:hypothetical protein [Phycisphaerales bacterium]
MDELKRVEFGDAGAMPEMLRAKVRRRRVVHRAKVGGAGLCVVMVTVVGVLIARPGVEVRNDGWRDGAVIGIDDPMFDALDQGRGMGRVDPRWRAGARLDGDWVLEM